MPSRLQHAYSVVHISTDFLQETTYNGRYVTDAQQKETLGAYEVMYTLLDIEPGTPLETSIGFMSIDLRSERKAQDVYASLQGKSISISGADSRGFHLVPGAPHALQSGCRGRRRLDRLVRGEVAPLAAPGVCKTPPMGVNSWCARSSTH